MKTEKVTNEIIQSESIENSQTKKSLLSKIRQKIVDIVKPGVKNLWHLTYIEVLWLMRAEEWLDLYPLDMYHGIIKWNLHYKKKVPMMKRLGHAGYDLEIRSTKTPFIIRSLRRLWDRRQNEKDMGQKIIEQSTKRGYITDMEIELLKKFWFTLTIECVPSIFIIAPKLLKDEKKLEVAAIEERKDPIILIKHGEDDFEPVHSWDNSQVLDKRLAKLN